MRLATIYPPALMLRLVQPEENYFLFLTDHVNNDPETYRKFVEDRRKSNPETFVILDSMAFEKPAGSTFEEMLSAANTISPDLIVLPDKRNATQEQNYDLLRAMIPKFQLQLKFATKFMAVPHAETWSAYVAYATKLAQNPAIAFLGIFEETVEKFDKKRSEVVAALAHLPVHFHLLGMTEDLEDIQDVFTRGRAFGCDSAKLAVWGYHKQLPTVGRVPKYPGRGDFLDITSIDETQAHKIKLNVLYWLNVASKAGLVYEFNAGWPTVSPSIGDYDRFFKQQPTQGTKIPVENDWPADWSKTALDTGLEEFSPMDLLIGQLATQLAWKGEHYNGQFEDPYKVLTWTKTLKLPEYVGVAARLADKFSRWENLLKACWEDGQQVSVMDPADLDEATLDLAGYALLFNLIYSRELFSDSSEVTT